MVKIGKILRMSRGDGYILFVESSSFDKLEIARSIIVKALRDNNIDVDGKSKDGVSIDF